MNRDQFESLVRIHQAHLLRYLRFLGAGGDAEDLVQATFLAVFSRPAALPADERGQAAWLRAIARNQLMTLFRRGRHAPAALDGPVLEEAERYWQRTFLREGDGFDYVEALRQCLSQLPSGQRRIVLLRYAEGESRSGMAEALQMTEEGVKTALRRIREVLGDCIERRLAESGEAP